MTRDEEPIRAPGREEGRAVRAHYCSSCFHYSLISDWSVSEAGKADALEQCPCCLTWRSPAGVLIAPFSYAAHSFGPLETEDDRDAAAEGRHRVPPQGAVGSASAAPGGSGPPLRMRHEHSASPLRPVPPGPPASAIPGYTSPRSRARWVLALLALSIAADMVSLLALGSQRSLLDRGAGQIGLADWHTSVWRVNRLSLVEAALYLATLIPFFLWLHRSYINLTKLGAGLRFTPGWAVGYWFVPVLNVVRSKQILDEVWHATVRRSGGTRAEAKRGPLAIFWVCALIVAWVTSRAATATHPASIGGLRDMNELLMASHLADIAAAALLYRVVSVVSTRQERGLGAETVSSAHVAAALAAETRSA